MAEIRTYHAGARLRCSACKAVAGAATGLLVGACAQIGSNSLQLANVQQQGEPVGAATTSADFRSELQKATEYWGKVYSKNPRDPQAALNYARNLKALGEKQQALAVLQQAAGFNGNHRGLLGEYGRLALDLDQVSVAQKLLEQADDAANPDWRVISARGTVLAKQGRYRDAIAFYERALTLAPNQASILNNLALAHAMEGDPAKAEPLLKRAVAAGGHDARVNQNLAIVLGLQGKYDEAKLSAARYQPPDNAAADVEYLKRIVRLDPKPMDQPASAAEPEAPAKTAAQEPASRNAPATTGALATANVPVKSATAQSGATKAAPKLAQQQPAAKASADEPAARDAPKGAAADDYAEEAPSSWSTRVAAAKKGAR